MIVCVRTVCYEQRSLMERVEPMAEMYENGQEPTEEVTVEEQDKQEQKSSQGSVFQGIYDQLPDISVRSVDRFILVCVIALVAVIVVGVLRAHHVF